MQVGLGTEGLEEVNAGVALGVGCFAAGAGLCVCRAAPPRCWRGSGLGGERCPALGLGAGLWSNPECTKAVVGIAREAVAVCVRARIEG